MLQNSLLNVGLERYFQMKETASQSDKADRRYTGLKLGVLNKNETSLADILRYVVKNPVRRLHLIAALLNFLPLNVVLTLVRK